MKTVRPSLIVLSALLLGSAAHASERRFAYTYSALTAPKGEVELENWVTLQSRPGVKRTWTFRHELEIGLTDHTQVGLYLAEWSHDGRTDRNAYKSSAIEVIHNLTNPVTDLVGSAIYGEVTFGERHLAMEGKLLLEKRIGAWMIGWNGKVEAEWEGSEFGKYHESNGQIAQTFGMAYELTKSLGAGFEVLHELALKKWHAPANQEVYIGPNLSLRKGRFYATSAVLFQTTDRKEQASMQVRLITGLSF